MPEDIAGAAGGKHLACGQNSGQNRRQDRGQDRVQDRGQVRARDAREPDSATLQKARPVQPNPPEDEDSGAAETAFLRGTPASAERLMASIREAEAGFARERGLVWPEEAEAPACQAGKPAVRRPL